MNEFSDFVDDMELIDPQEGEAPHGPGGITWTHPPGLIEFLTLQNGMICSPGSSKRFFLESALTTSQLCYHWQMGAHQVLFQV